MGPGGGVRAVFENGYGVEARDVADTDVDMSRVTPFNALNMVGSCKESTRENAFDVCRQTPGTEFFSTMTQLPHEMSKRQVSYG